MFRVIILLLTLFVFGGVVMAQDVCGDDEISIPEACDPGSDFYSDNNENAEVVNDVFPDGSHEGVPIEHENGCETLGEQIIGDLGCYGSNDIDEGVSSELECQFDVSQCNFEFVGVDCVSCDQCEDTGILDDGVFGDCPQNLCVNYCPNRGSCYYDPGIGEDCLTCQEVVSCSWYTNDLDCNGDVCNLLIDAELHPDCEGTCSDDATVTCVDDQFCEESGLGECEFGDLENCRMVWEKDFPCIWIDGECQPNWDCEWDCDIYDELCLNGVRAKKDTASCELGGDSDPLECFDPTDGYPDEIACNVFDKEFPVFGFFNIIMSMILLISYYAIRKFKND